MKHRLPKGALPPLQAMEILTDLTDDDFDGYRELIDEFPRLMAVTTPAGDLVALLCGKRGVEIETKSGRKRSEQIVMPGPTRLGGFTERVKRHHLRQLHIGQEVEWIEINPGDWRPRDTSACSFENFDWEAGLQTIAGVAYQIRLAPAAQSGKAEEHATRARRVEAAARWMFDEAIRRADRGELPTKGELIDDARRQPDFATMAVDALKAAWGAASKKPGWPESLNKGGRRRGRGGNR